MSIFLRATGAALLAIALTACERTPDVVKIGVGQPLSGPTAAKGRDLLQGVQMAVDEINAGGGLRMNGRRVQLEVVVADDQADPKLAKATAKKLVDAGVTVAIADLNSGVSIEAAPVYAAAGVPQLAISTKPEYTQLGYPTTLRLVANDSLQSRAMSGFAAQLDGKHYAVIDDGTAYGTGLADATAGQLMQLGKAISLRRTLDNKTVDFHQLIADIAEQRIDVIVTTLGDFQAAALLQQLARQGLAGLQLIGADNMKTTRILAASGLLHRVYATTPIVEAREFPRGPAFLAKFRQRFGGDPVYGAHYAYDAAYLVADALERTGSTDRRVLLEELKSPHSYGRVTGNMHFELDGEQRWGMVAVYQLNKGDWRLEMRSDVW